MDIPSNALAAVFGRVLRQLRARRSKSSREVARSLEISESAYRLIEAGGAILNPVHTPMLISVFQSLVWQRLLAFLTCAEAAKKDSEEYWKTARLVGELDPDLNVLIEDGLHDLRNPRHPATQNSEHDAIPAHCVEAVQRYLERETLTQSRSAREDIRATSAKTLAEWAAFAPNAVSPIQLDMLLWEIQTLQHFPPNVPPKEIALWEEQNAGSFKNVYAFIDDLAAAEQLAGKFHWDYLFLKEFGTVKILAAHVDGFAAAKDIFLRKIAGVKGGGEMNFKRVSKRVQIEEIAGSDLEKLRQLLRYDTWEGRLADKDNSHCVPLNNVWLYELKRNDLTVGFVDSWQGGDDFRSVTLSKGETALLKPHLIAPWKNQRRTSR